MPRALRSSTKRFLVFPTAIVASQYGCSRSLVSLPPTHTCSGDDVVGMKVAFFAATSSAIVSNSAVKSGTVTGPCVVPLSLIPNAAST
jgi:hypothetical protein